MNNENFGCIGFIILVVMLFVIDFGVSKAVCTSKANALGYLSDYKIFQGCVLEKPNGKKVLLEQLRDFE